MSQDDAKAAGLLTYNTGKPCVRGHTCDRYTSTRGCIECLRERDRTIKRVRNLEERKRANARYYSMPEKMAAQVERTRKWRAANPEKHQAIYTAYVLKHKEKRKEQIKQWRQANLEKSRTYCRNRHARKKAVGGWHTGEEIQVLGNRQKWRCANPKCRKSLKSGYDADHIMPLLLGGSNAIRNIQLLCPSCNRRKQAKHPVKWARELGLLI